MILLFYHFFFRGTIPKSLPVPIFHLRADVLLLFSLPFFFWAQVVRSRHAGIYLSPLITTVCKVTSQAHHFATALSNKKAESYYCASAHILARNKILTRRAKSK